VLSNLPQDIDWALSSNPEIVPILLAKYPATHGYWAYLDTLVKTLRGANCKNIQEKFVDVANNLSKFESTISELEIARLLSQKGKQVELLTDSFLPTKSPDMLVKDANGEYYVEAMRFSDDETSGIIFDGLRSSISRLPTPVYVDVTLPQDLSLPVTRHNERQMKETKAKTVVEQFNNQIAAFNLRNLPTTISIDGVTFHLSKSASKAGPRFINSSGIVVPSQKYVDRIRYITTLKAEKRATWLCDHLKKKYIVAVDCEQMMLDNEDVDQALLGYRETYLPPLTAPKAKIPNEVTLAANRSWSSFLKKVHLIPTANTIFTSYGVFLTEPICKHVSGVLVRVGSRYPYFVPNPFADALINDSSLVGFV